MKKEEKRKIDYYLETMRNKRILTIKNSNERKVISMKATGIVRKVDELGRIVFPIELRRQFDIKEKDSLEIYVDGDKIILKKYEPECIFCGEVKDITVYKGKNVCPACMKDLKK
jgi:transcriptional pleiotropic regulator of transition state genes